MPASSLFITGSTLGAALLAHSGGEEPCWARPALPKSACGAGLSAASRRLRLPGCHRSCPHPTGDLSTSGPELVFSLSPGDVWAFSSHFSDVSGPRVQIQRCCAQRTRQDCTQQEPRSHSRIGSIQIQTLHSLLPAWLRGE